MAFDDVAKRMKDRRGATRGERLEAIWTGEEPKLPELPAPVPPARRTAVILGAYAVLFAGLAIVVAAGIVLLLWFGTTSTWERRGLYAIAAIGIGLVVKSTTMFDAAANTAPLPDARLR